MYNLIIQWPTDKMTSKKKKRLEKYIVRSFPMMYLTALIAIVLYKKLSILFPAQAAKLKKEERVGLMKKLA